MKAAQLVAARQWEMIEVEKPVPRDGLMLVRMERAAICGTDKPYFTGVSDSYPLDPGRTGHEGMGIVEANASGIHQEGDRVLLWGADRGLFQEYVLANPTGCIPLPQQGEPEALLISQLLGTVIHCFYKLGNLINQRVVVLGQGPVGQLFNATLRNFGARDIIAVDLLDYRLEIAKQMGATDVLNPSKCSLIDAVAEITNGEMADVVVEAVGKEETFNQCTKMCRHSGTVVYFGVPNKDNAEGVMNLQFLEMFTKEIRLVTSVGPNPEQDYTIARDWITQKRVNVEPIVSHVWPFARIQDGFEAAFDHPERENTMKIVLTFD